MVKKENILKTNGNEIKWNIINSLLAGGLVFLGSLIGAEGFTWYGLGAGFIGGMIVCLTKFKDYWITQEGEYKRVKVFNFV